MDWINVEHSMPIAYKTGMFDGRKSDEILAEDASGKRYLATYYEGTMDGSEFSDWYDSSDYEITEPIVRWLEIPE